MSGETARQESGWTVDTLKQHYDKLREADQIAIQAALVTQEKAVAAALAATKEAMLKAETASEKRFESVNEFRKTLSDQTNTFLPRSEYNANHKALEDKIDTKCTALEDKIQGLTDRMNITSGKTEGSDKTVGKIVTAISVTGVILSIVILLANKVF